MSFNYQIVNESYIIEFTADSYDEAFEYFNNIADLVIEMSNNTLAVKLQGKKGKIRRLLFSEMKEIINKIELIDDISEIDIKSDEERLNEILDIILLYGFDHVTLEDKSFLKELSKKL